MKIKALNEALEIAQHLVGDLDSGDWYDIYHTETGLPHPLKPPASQLEALIKELNRLKDPDYDDALDVIGKYQQKSSKIVKVESKGTAMQLSKLNEIVEDAFDLKEGYTKGDILKFTKMVAKKAANMFRKEHAAFVKKHKLNVNDGGVLGSSEADASWDDFLDLLLDELDSEGIDLQDSHEPGEVLTEASKERKQLDKIENHFEKLEKSAEFLFRMNKDLRDKSWDKAILALDQEIADLAMAIDHLED